MTYKSKWLLLYLACLLSACGYRIVGAGNTEKMAVGVPFIRGDKNGILTAATIEELNKSQLFISSRARETYSMKIEILSELDDKRGFQYRTDTKTGEIPDNRILSSVENEWSARVRVTIVHGVTEEPLVDPFEVSATLDYDYVDSLSFNDLAFTPVGQERETVLNASLGQLDAEEDASLIAKSVLYRKLARKIASTATFAILSHEQTKSASS